MTSSAAGSILPLPGGDQRTGPLRAVEPRARVPHLAVASPGRETVQDPCARRDEVAAAGTWTAPLLCARAVPDDVPHPHPAGTTGPHAAHALLARDGRSRHEETP